MKVSEIEAQLSSLKAQRLPKLKVRALAMSDDSDTTDVQKGVASVDDLQKQIDDLQAQLDAVKKAQGLSDDKPDDAEPTDKKGNNNMQIDPNKKQETTEVRDFIHYLKTAEKRANGITTTEAGVVIPKEILDIQKYRLMFAICQRLSIVYL